MNTHNLDVLIVYTENVAMSASDLDPKNTSPFALSVGREHYGVAYAYFLSQCKKTGLKAAFATSYDVIGPGTVKSFWTIEDNSWKKVQEDAYAPIIFDKVSPIDKKLKDARALLFKKGVCAPFNDPLLLGLFNDKLKTFNKLNAFTIPTVGIAKETVEKSVARLIKLVLGHKNKNDFSKGFVLKDRFGAGGVDIYKIGKNPVTEITKILTELPNISFVLQPFAKFEQGYKLKDEVGYADIRLIFSQGEVVQRYIRTAKKDDFRCNEHQGGKVSYVGPLAIPQAINDASSEIMALIKGEKSLFALDFIVSNNKNVYFLEGNINPGIYWGINSDLDKINTKKLIVTIIKELKRRTNLSQIIPVTKNFPISNILPISL